jgi:hypothetical protein
MVGVGRLRGWWARAGAAAREAAVVFSATREGWRAARARYRYPDPVVYLACGACGGVTPHSTTTQAVTATFRVEHGVVQPDEPDVVRTPPEAPLRPMWRHPAAGGRGPGPGQRPGRVPPAKQVGRRCGYRHQISADALQATCPRCLATSPTPAPG